MVQMKDMRYFIVIGGASSVIGVAVATPTVLLGHFTRRPSPTLDVKII